MIVEMRTYQTRAGTREQFLHVFEELSIPEHWRLGMSIAGPFASIDDPDIFFFMRGFPDAGSRETLKASFYDGPLWTERLEAELMPLLERYEVVVIDDAEGRIAWRTPDSHPRQENAP